MANRKVSKSAAVREMLEANPKTPTQELRTALAAKGIKVSNNLVYLVKAKMGAKRRKAKQQRAVTAGKNSGVGDAVALIRSVKSLAEEAGGIGKLKQLVDILVE